MLLRTLVTAAVVAWACVLVSCDSSRGSAARSETGLQAALALVPDDAAQLWYTDWSALGHQDVVGKGPAFADNLVRPDVLGENKLGIRAVDAQWQADVMPHGAPITAVTILQYDAATDLAAVEARFVALGYRKSRTGGRDRLAVQPGAVGRLMTLLPVVEIDTRKHLLVGGIGADDVDAIFADGRSLADRADVSAALRHAGAVVGAALEVGDTACSHLDDLAIGASPAKLAALRRKLTAPGSLSPMTVDAVTVPDAAGTSGTANLVFLDSSYARANQNARAAAPAVVADGYLPIAPTVVSSAVSDNVLALSLRVPGSGELPKAVGGRALGFDVCL